MKVVIADDHPLFRTALTQAVEQCVASAELVMLGSSDELVSMLARTAPPDLLLLDLNMPGARGYSALVNALSLAPGLPVIVISAYEDPQVARAALDHGASGFIPKSSPPSVLAEAITAVRSGQAWVPADYDLEDVARNDFADRLALLTPQQQRVLVMLTDGLLNKQIAGDLGISEATIKAHITAILRKLGVQTRTQAVIAAQSLDLDWSNYARSQPEAPK